MLRYLAWNIVSWTSTKIISLGSKLADHGPRFSFATQKDHLKLLTRSELGPNGPLVLFNFNYLCHTMTNVIILATFIHMSRFCNYNILLTLTMLNFLNEIILLTFLALSIISFRDIKIKTWRWSQQYRTWSDCMDVHAGLALYCWQRLITFGVGRIRVKTFNWQHLIYSKIPKHVACIWFLAL